MPCDIVIRGVNVSFPYQPYKVQEDFMEKVIECLQRRENGLLESPTGTGKTLSLLCSSLAWLEQKKALTEANLIQHQGKGLQVNSAVSEIKTSLQEIVGSVLADEFNFTYPKIIYSSRTHSQLSQVVQEFKRTSYKHFTSVVIGSREQLCLNQQVNSLTGSTNKLHACRAKVATRTCPYYLNVEQKMLTEKDYVNNSVLDIEDLVSLGEKHKCCPYYASRTLKNKADILFTPYNYLLDASIRKAQAIELQGNILIFDEAHNIERVCEDSMSFQLRSKDLASCMKDVDEIIKQLKPNSEYPQFSGGIAPEFSLTDVINLKVMFSELEKYLDEHAPPVQGESLIKPGDFIFDVLSRAELTVDKIDSTLDLLDKMILYLTTLGMYNFFASGNGLQNFSDMLRMIFSGLGKVESPLMVRGVLAKNYVITIEHPNKSTEGKSVAVMKRMSKDWVLHGWCLFAGLSMSSLKALGIHSMILTSGTLTPLSSFATELGLPFPNSLENPHIISRDQVFVGVISKGPDNTALNSSYKNRSSEKYLDSLGRTILNFSRVVPGGLLVFFVSYKTMRDSVDYWNKSQLWDSMVSVKPIFVEASSKQEFLSSLKEYSSKIQEPNSKGATFFGVFQGKLSEGLDFADNNARAVIITGLPFAPMHDLRVKLKMKYLNENKEKELNGSSWYLLQATRAVNQAIGRVIRHRNDFGAVLLCDDRFTELRIKDRLSKWIVSQITHHEMFGHALGKLTQFFKIHGTKTTPQLVTDSVPRNAFGCGEERKRMTPKITVTTYKQHRPQVVVNATEKSEDIISEYQGAGCTVVDENNDDPRRKRQSVFAALDSVETSNCVYSAVLAPSTTMVDKENSNTPSESSATKKRKLNVKLRGMDGDAGVSSVKTEVRNSVNQNSLLETFQAVKTLLTPEKYLLFKTAVTVYLQDKNAEKFARSAVNAFQNVSVSSELVCRLSKFVPQVASSLFTETFKKLHPSFSKK